MFRFNRQDDDVLNHWISFADNFNFSPQEFYSAVEKRLAERQIPGLEMSRLDYNEGGLLSDKRIYFRMIRERLAFDVCAAPFGTSYFFSCRTVHAKPEVKFWHLLVALFASFTLLVLSCRVLGFLLGMTLFVGLFGILLFTLWSGVAAGIGDLDTTLLKIPVISPIYERWFRRETYYRQDTRLVYLEIVPKLVREVAEETAATKGVKLVRQYESAPVLDELYRPVTSTQRVTSA